MKGRPEYLIVDAAAVDYASEIARLTNSQTSGVACCSPEEALSSYSGQAIIFGNPAMVAEVLPELSNLRWVQSTWAGVTPLTTLPRRDYTLTGVKDVFGPPMAEYVMAYLLAHEVKVLERMQQQRARNWFTARSGTVHGKQMVILGTGSIGAHIAAVARSFGVRTTGLNRSGAPSSAFDTVMPVNELQQVLASCDYLIATLPATAETNHLLDSAALAALPAHAYFINVGRSNVVDDDALVRALRAGRLAGAALDVFDTEPLPKDSPLWETSNLVITAHRSAPSHPSFIAPVFVENYRRYCEKLPLNYVIDFDRGY